MKKIIHIIYIIIIIILLSITIFSLNKNKSFSSKTNLKNGISSLEGKTGEDLNKAFLLHMIPHHLGAVEAAKYIANSNRSELVELSKNITSSQAEEIMQMKKWLKDWYDVDYDQENTMMKNKMDHLNH